MNGDADQPFLDISQNTEAWFDAKRGRVSASRISDIIAKAKSGTFRASREGYAAELICERLTGKTADSYKSASMIRGSETEPEARNLYALLSDVDVRQVGFVLHPHIPMAGASPDGWCAENGEVQFKAPDTATHIATLLGAPVPSNYQTQMQWGLACSGRDWCDWVSYDNRVPPEMQIFIQRFHRDPRRIVELEAEVRDFLAEVDRKIEALRAAYPRA